MRIQSPKTLRRNQQQRSMPDPVAPSEPYRVDVVVPFWSGDSQWLAECVEGLLHQNHCTPIIHVIADACEFPPLPALQNTSAEIIRYRTNKPPGRGPYRLTNALVRHGHCRTDYLALNDADDISLPDRLWRQVSVLQQSRSVMISSGMEQFCDGPDEDMRRRLANEPLLFPGRIYSCVPDGSGVNSMRLVRLEFFRSLNGFCNMFCGGDFEFDARARKFSRKIIDHREILGRRRLHQGSLSHGLVPHGSSERIANDRTIMANLAAVKKCRKCAPNFGAMETAFELEIV